ncbi:MAG: hypothetical protein HY507_01685 [Candidatus Zambryskibacteria bacterium]|nr:hypothetical protein [Candidatus Zambryskibacteria bacterium]
MEDKTQNNTQEFIKNLPQAVQDLVFDGEWEKRVTEIAKKYSLGPGQTDTLINNVLFVLIGLDTPDTFTSLMTSELGISKLLAGQIIEDLENRVFEYALGVIENKQQKLTPIKSKIQISNFQSNPKSESQKVTVEQSNNVFANIKAEVKKTDGAISHVPYVPEVRPANLPVVEKGEPVRINKPKIEAGSENIEIRQKSENIIDSKLNNVVKSVKEEKVISEIPAKKYGVDPYREPIE